MAIPADVLTNWSGGQLLAFSGIDGRTDYHGGLTLRTSFDTPGLDIKLPGQGRVAFDEEPSGLAQIGGDWFVRSPRTCGAFVDAYHLLIEGPCRLESGANGLRWMQEGTRTLVGSAAHFSPEHIRTDPDHLIGERQKWLASREVAEGLSAAETHCLYKALSQMKTMIYSPEGRLTRRFSTPDRWPHRAMWLWDSAFHAIGMRHVDIELARDILRVVLEAQHDSGFVPHCITPEGSVSENTQPPVLALATHLLQETSPDRDWLAQMYPLLSGYVRWDLDNRDSDGTGLVEWRIEGDPNCRSGESGMDNSPRFDNATQLDATDFNAFVAHECELLAQFAEQLGKSDEAARWRREHRRLCELIDSRLWNDRLGFYVDYDVDKGAQSPALASAGFMPLVCGAPSPERATRLAQALTDPTMFGAPLPIPSIAVRDTEHYQKDMWRGPVWVNINWLAARGFERYGMDREAAMLRKKTMAEIEKYVSSHGTFFEFYDDRREAAPPALNRKGCCDPHKSPYHQVFHDYGWSATLYVDMLLGR